MKKTETENASAIGENIRAIRDDSGCNQDEFGRLVGVSQGTVSMWERGDSTPRQVNIDRMLEAFPGLTADDIYSEEYGFARRADKNGRDLSGDYLPLYGAISAGVPLSMFPVEDHVAVSRKLRSRFPRAFFLRVHGKSMNRVLPDGCLALVNPTSELEEGAVYAVSVGDSDATVKRVHMLPGKLELLPDSDDPSFEPMCFDLSNPYATPRVLGRVVWFTMPDDFTL